MSKLSQMIGLLDELYANEEDHELFVVEVLKLWPALSAVVRAALAESESYHG